MEIPPDVGNPFAECCFRLNKEDIPENLLNRMPKCLRAEGCFCNLDDLVKKKRRSNES